MGNPGSTIRDLFAILLLLLLPLGDISLPFVSSSTLLPPLPILPLPSAPQLKWQHRERIMFFHFGMNTFTNSEWGTGKVDPNIFHPSRFDARQWVKVAKASGFSLVILTAKHHDGFCLWPSAYTNYSVKSSSWKDGRGDVVRELSEAAKEEGVDLGLYLSPWDRHDPRYGRTDRYNQYYMAQLQELLTKYGTISEIWFDGAKGSDAPKMNYMFTKWFALTRELQGGANMFSDAGPDVRWVGDESGAAGSTCWSMMNRSHAKIGAGADLQLLNTGDRNGKNWLPPECDVSIRPGWFWHEDERPKSLKELLNLYYHSVGRNCVLLLNAPPNSSGLISAEDVTALMELRQAIDSIFSVNLAANATVKSSSVRGEAFNPTNVLDDEISTYWAPAEGHKKGRLRLQLSSPTTFNVVKLQEAIGMGQRVMRYSVKVREGNKWHAFSNGTTIGYKKLDMGCVRKAREVEVVVEEARADPLIASVGLYLDLKSGPIANLSCKLG